MRRLKGIFIVGILVVAIVLVSATWNGTTPDSIQDHNANSAMTAQTSSPSAGSDQLVGYQRQSSQQLNWPEAGLTLFYPGDWSLISDQNFDFVLLGPQDESTDGILFIAMQSGRYDIQNESLEDVVGNLADDSAIEAVSFDEAEAWQFEFADEANRTRIIGFSPANGHISILILTSPVGAWDEWDPIFTQIINEASFTPLALDYETLNAQMQENLEATGFLTVGDPDAPVLIVEFMDFSCGHCATFSPAADRLVQDQVMSGNVRFTLSVLTFVGGPLSETAAQAQYCGTQLGVGWNMHELLFKEYAAEGAQVAYTRDHITDIVAEADLDIDLNAFEECMDEDISDWLAANSALSTELGVTGTPTLFVGTSMDNLEVHPRRDLMGLYETIEALAE